MPDTPKLDSPVDRWTVDREGWGSGWSALALVVSGCPGGGGDGQLAVPRWWGQVQVREAATGAARETYLEGILGRGSSSVLLPHGLPASEEFGAGGLGRFAAVVAGGANAGLVSQAFGVGCAGAGGVSGALRVVSVVLSQVGSGKRSGVLVGVLGVVRLGVVGWLRGAVVGLVCGERGGRGGS